MEIVQKQSIESNSKDRTIAMLFGVGTVVLYALLFLKESLILDLSSRGGFYFIVPLLIAFLFSFVHGTFTDSFWRALGIRSKDMMTSQNIKG